MANPEANGEQFPRPGHEGDLHEWAKKLDAQADEERSKNQEAAKEGIRSLLRGDDSTLSEAERLALAEQHMSDLERLAVSRSGYRMADVFTGQAYNG